MVGALAEMHGIKPRIQAFIAAGHGFFLPGRHEVL